MSQSLAEILPRYFSLNPDIRTEDTKAHYWRSLRFFGEYLGRPPSLDDLNDDALIGFLIWSVGQGLHETTANQRAKQLRALWVWCAKRRLVEAWPTYKDLREPELMPEAWTMDQLHRLFTGCARQRGWIGPHPANLWWLTFHWFLYDTAERTTATLALRRAWVDMEKHTASIPPQARKGGYKGQVYKLSPRTCELLGQMFDTPSPTGLVFDNPWKNEKSFYGRYQSLVKDCGLAWVKRKTGPKKMRATVFTMIEVLGGDATKFARHSARSVTEAYLDRTILLAQQQQLWPPTDLDPERRPPSWRNLWGWTG